MRVGRTGLLFQQSQSDIGNNLFCVLLSIGTLDG